MWYRMRKYYRKIAKQYKGHYTQLFFNDYGLLKTFFCFVKIRKDILVQNVNDWTLRKKYVETEADWYCRIIMANTCITYFILRSENSGFASTFRGNT